MLETAHSPEPVANPPQIVMMPIDGLFVPDWNPRETMSEAGLQILVDFVKAGKPLERLLVWKGSGQAAGSPKEPAQPGLASRLEASTQGPFAVISGQRRLEAYRRAGVKLVEVEILDIPLEEAKDRASTSNEGEEVPWLEDFEYLERRLGDDPAHGAIADLASRLGRNRTEVSRAYTLIRLLTPKARRMIKDTLPKDPPENKGNNAIRSELTNGDPQEDNPAAPWVLQKTVAMGLTGLWKDNSLEEAQALVEKALPVILARQMTEGQVRRLVAELKAGTPAEDIKIAPPLKKGESKGVLASGEAVPTPAAPAPGKASQALSAGLAGLASLASKASAKLGSTGQRRSKGSGGGKGFGAQVGSLLWSELKRAFGYLIRKWIVTGVAVLVVVLILSPHLYVNLWHLTPGQFGFAGTQGGLPVKAVNAGGQALVVPSQSAAGNGGIQPGSVHLAFGYPGTHQSTAPQGGGQGLVVPSQGAEVNGGTKPGSVQAPIAEKPKAQNHPLASKPKGSNHPHLPAVSPSVNSGQALQRESKPSTASAKTIPAWSQGALPAAGDFANRFYGISYSNWNDTLNYLKAQTVGKDAPAQIDQYFPASLQQQMQVKMLAQYFSAQGTKIVGGEGDSAEVLVQGTVTTMTRAGRTAQTVSTKPVALLMAFRHVEGFGNKIEKVTEVDPQTGHLFTGPQAGEQALIAPSQGADGTGGTTVGSVKGDFLKDVSNAASTVNNTASAVDQAKKVLGF